MSSPDPTRARIVYWGPPQAGVTSNLKLLHARLRPERRGALQTRPLSGAAACDLLPIDLGSSGAGIDLIGAPSGEDQAVQRQQLLAGIDGAVLVADARPDSLPASLVAFAELREALASHGRSIEDLPLVVQLNRSDEAQPAFLLDLRRKLDLPDAPCFEAVARDGPGVLETLRAISKAVVHARTRRAAPAPPEATAAPPARGAPTPSDTADEAAELAALAETLDQAKSLFDRPFHEVVDSLAVSPRPGPPRFTAAETGRAVVDDSGEIRLPLRLTDDTGRSIELTLRVAIEPADEG